MPKSIELTQEQADGLIQLYEQGKFSEVLIEGESLGMQFPEVAFIPHLLGAVYAGLGKPKQAISNFRKALHIDPNLAEVHNNLGVTLKALGNVDEAIASYNQAIQINPNSIEAFNNLANALIATGRLEDAVECYRKILQLTPNDANTLYILGNSLRELGKLDDAESSYRKSFQLAPGNADTAFFLGVTLNELEKHEEAIICYKQAVGIRPDYAEAYNNLASTFCALEKYEEANSYLNIALKINPNFIEAYYNLGSSLIDLCKPEEASALLTKALEIKPEHADLHKSLGISLQDQGKFGEAEQCYKTAIRFRPNYAEAHLNLAQLLLQKGDLVNGWSEYERRLDLDIDLGVSEHNGPLVSEKSLSHKTILLISEQGLGDEIMFASCIPDISNITVKSTVLLCDERLKEIFSRSFPTITVYNRKELSHLKQKFDLKYFVGSLPSLFRKHPRQFPNKKSYLAPNTQLLEIWRDRYRDLPENITIGISWRGGKSTKDKFSRSIDLSKWQALLDQKANFVNLQYGNHTEEIVDFSNSTGISIYNWEDANPLNEIDNFAAQISALDLVISIDNSTVHLAGALGVPTWTLLPFNSDWRWFLEKENSPWYPSMRLFRQKKTGTWSDVLNKVNEELVVLLSKQS